MPKGRIGLSLSEDVLAILAKYGRSEINHYTSQRDFDAAKKDQRPTRTEIIEQAVREWAARQETLPS